VVDFGGTDAFMTNKEMAAAGGGVLHIPTVMGSVAVIFNLPGISDLKLDAGSLAGIYLGEITKWNDPIIKALNPGKNLPDKNITVVRRSDGSGTTSIFTNYLTKVSTKWASSVGEGKSVNWPVGVGGKGNFGVAGVVKQVEGAIGYVELAYAIENNLSFASLKNKAGRFVSPTIESTSAAAAGALAAMPADFRINLTNASGAASYPIVGLTWIVVKQHQKNSENATTLKNLLLWCLQEGQNYAESLHYAPLPSSLAQKVMASINTID
jgi:phosphate transport system substrate-binding protein